MVGLLRGAIGLAGRELKVSVPPSLAIDAEVDLTLGEGGYALQARLKVSLPGLDREVAQKLVDEAEATCPYSKAIRGNVDVQIELV